VSASNGTAPKRHVPRLALTVDELAQSLGCSRDHIERHVAHELRWVYRGRRKFVAVAEIEAWLARSAVRPLDAEVCR
jgi:excisionase family DNA binding protein